jgi:hypothetical protein
MGTVPYNGRSVAKYQIKKEEKRKKRERNEAIPFANKQ